MASDPGKFSCEICSENLRSKTGACVATVSLFSETSNKEFSNACNGKPVVFAELLRVLGIVLVQDRQRSVCKKCARKIVNCYKLFTELQQAFIHGESSLFDLRSATSQSKQLSLLSASVTVNLMFSLLGLIKKLPYDL